MNLIYHLAHEILNGKNHLTVRVEGAPPRKEALLKCAASSSEKSALEALLKYPLVGPAFAVPREHAFALLKQLGGTGRLHFQGKKVLVDPFTPFEWIFFLEAQEGGITQIAGRWKMGAQSGAIHEAEWFFPGNPSFLLAQGILRPLKEEVPAQWMRKVLTGPILLDEVAMQEFLEEFEGEPCLEWKDKPSTPSHQMLPFLVLQDRHGAFADLWFDYGRFGKVASHDPVATSWRSPQVEKEWERDLLETDFAKKIVDRSHYFCSMDKVAKSLTFLLEMGWSVFDAKGRKVCRSRGEEVQAELKGHTLYLRSQTRYDEHKAELGDVVGAFTRREHFVELSAGSVGLIDRSAIEKQWGDLLEEELVSDAIAIPKHRFGLLSHFMEEREAGFSEDLARKLKSLTAFAPSAPVAPGKEFRATLFTYQSEGLQWLKFLEEGGLGGLLADEMGLGKTVQVLAFFSQLVLSAPCLIVVPTSLLFHWKREFEKFVENADVYVHAGKERMKSAEELSSKQWILTSYALLRIDAELFQGVSYQCVVLDEGQVIKNPESQIATACCKLKAQMRLIITGTPIENRFDDLWSLFHFLLPGLLKERKNFQSETLAGQSDVRYLERIKKKIRPFILRRKKESVALQLPPKLEQVVYIEMTEEQRAVYEAFLQKTQSGLLKKVQLEGAASHRMQILEAILRLRQLCAHPWLVEGSDQDPFAMSAKYDRLFSDLAEVVEEGRKVLVYSQFTQMLKLIEKEVKQRGWKYVYLDGSTQNREKIVSQFQEDPETTIFLISLKAGGVGLNLTAADYVFLYDPWWNEAVEQQAIDRAHRVGKQNTLIARRYVTALSIEEKIMHLKNHKKALAESLIEGSSDFESIGIDELLQLLV